MIPTPHISAKKEEIASTVIMPGDPLRSKYIAENFLENAVLVNNVRGVQGYTGLYNGKKVTVMAHGMGNPSMGIYSYELFKFYDVDKIIRIGTIGAAREDMKIKELIIAEKVMTNTNFNNFYINNGESFVLCNEDLLNEAKELINKKNIITQKHHIGAVLCSDTFYSDENELEKIKKNNLLGVEMESASLYINAKRTNKKALVICTVSDNIITGEKSSSEEREKTFSDMVKFALELA